MLEGVPPNMSVSINTPCPSSAADRVSSIELRISSTDWLGSIATAWKVGASGRIRRSACRNSCPSP